MKNEKHELPEGESKLGQRIRHSRPPLFLFLLRSLSRFRCSYLFAAMRDPPNAAQQRAANRNEVGNSREHAVGVHRAADRVRGRCGIRTSRTGPLESSRTDVPPTSFWPKMWLMYCAGILVDALLALPSAGRRARQTWSPRSGRLPRTRSACRRHTRS